nr:uncharacterized protein LOC101125895 isoform X2 [Gorilla gorilla gorilla]
MERPIHRVRGRRRPQEPPPPIVHAPPQSWEDPPPTTAAAGRARAGRAGRAGSPALLPRYEKSAERERSAQPRGAAGRVPACPLAPPGAASSPLPPVPARAAGARCCPPAAALLSEPCRAPPPAPPARRDHLTRAWLRPSPADPKGLRPTPAPPRARCLPIGCGRPVPGSSAVVGAARLAASQVPLTPCAADAPCPPPLRALSFSNPGRLTLPAHWPAAAPTIGSRHLSVSWESSAPPGRKRLRPHWIPFTVGFSLLDLALP